MLVPKIIAATTYAPLSNARIPAIIANSPPAKTSVTMSKMAIHIAFDGCTPFLCPHVSFLNCIFAFFF